MSKILSVDTVNCKENGAIPKPIAIAMEAYANWYWWKDQGIRGISKASIDLAEKQWQDKRAEMIKWLKLQKGL